MVELKNIDFQYRRNKPVLSGITLSLKPGVIYGLLGKNGEGKTTLLHLMSGLLFPDGGSLTVDGKEPPKRHADFLSRIFLLPEEVLLPDVTAEEYFRMYRPFYPTFSEDILSGCIRSLDIETGARLRKMSLGQKKKVAIALALAVHTPLLLMDEPTNGLDIPSKSIFRRLMATLTDETQTVIISTHQVRDLESLIDAVVILDDRKILLNRSLEEVSRKLSFRTLEAGETALYEEATPVGRVGALLTREGEEAGAVSLELLFNAAVSAKKEIRDLFNS
jgi:ABC-2 type transport system ATP-binding protein